MKTEIIPVIHMIDENQVSANIKTCIECGVEKVFLINHVVSVIRLISCVLGIKHENPNLWFGINMLGTTTEDALSLELAVDGLWCDASITQEKIDCRRFKGMFFGGLAFKYQPQPKDLELACEEAILTTDVATTSGEGTGQAANIEKIKTIRGFLGDHPMAIASGVSVENINDYKGVVDYLLVASSITDSDEMIIKNKLVELYG